MLPPVVFFKKISRKSYANDIHKRNHENQHQTPDYRWILTMSRRQQETWGIKGV
jgi:hypothetical protein